MFDFAKRKVIAVFFFASKLVRFSSILYFSNCLFFFFWFFSFSLSLSRSRCVSRLDARLPVSLAHLNANLSDYENQVELR